MRVLVLNSGSPSIKYELYDALRAVRAGKVEELGGAARLTRKLPAAAPEPVQARDHREGFRAVLRELGDTGALAAVEHRVVHGGSAFRAPALLDEAALRTLRDLSHLAPLHNAGSILSIEVALAELPHVPQVAVFDTAFHATLPERAFRYALPRALADRHGIRRYGFHGTSHAYVARRAAALLQRPLEELNLITLHLGNGCHARPLALWSVAPEGGAPYFSPPSEKPASTSDFR